jgi:hypothetical protein
MLALSAQDPGLTEAARPDELVNKLRLVTIPFWPVIV